MEGIKYQVWMPELVDLDEDQDEHGVHDSRVELEAGVAGAEVEYPTTNTL